MSTLKLARMPRQPSAGTNGTARRAPDNAAAPQRKRLPSEHAANRLHPVQVEFSYPGGSRIDMERRLPFDLGEEDLEELVDSLSSPAEYAERISPVSTILNAETISGKNRSDLDTKFIGHFAKSIARAGGVVTQASRANFGERGAVSFLGLGLDPDTIAQIIELDYETADNVYTRLSEAVEKGLVTPLLTTPFHTLLPLYQHDFEIRLLVRMGLEIYWPLLRKYNRAVLKTHGEKQFTAVAWLPEGAYSARVLQILHAEFAKKCEEEKVAPSHLVLLLDCEQSKEREHDLLMKRWNTLRPAPTTRDIVSVVFKERLFSDWVVNGHPSTKKQLDRTIAKVDAVLRDTGKDHMWAHFEPLFTLLSTFKTCQNFEQKVIKLTELGYQPCAPDLFVRRKLLKLYGMEENEPRRTTLRDNTSWQSYADSPGSLAMFKGVEDAGAPAGRPTLAPNREYARRTPSGVKREAGNPCWKPALMAALQNVHRAVVGEPKTFMGGMLGLMSSLMPTRRVPVIMRNIEEFLVRSSRIHWKEHFIHHVCSEADIQLAEICEDTLLKDLPEGDEAEMSEEAIVTMGVCAQSVYHAHMGLCSAAFAPEHLDQRHAYHAVAMMSLSVVHALAALRWNEKPDECARLFGIFKTELMDFKGAYQRHGIDKLGVDRAAWDRTIASQIEESDLNLVERAARRVGAVHLRKAGYRNEFNQSDEFLSTAVGHLWSTEIDHLNLKWENEFFCGLAEE